MIEGLDHIDTATWIEVDYAGGWMYQKVDDGMLFPAVRQSQSRLAAMTYREWREQTEGKPWAEIARQYEGVTR